MPRRALWMAVVGGAVAAALLAPTPVYGKVLPYQLEVSTTAAAVGEPIQITAHIDPANDLGANAIDWLVKAYEGDRIGANFIAITMRPVGNNEYRGVFTPRNPGSYVIHGGLATSAIHVSVKEISNPASAERDRSSASQFADWPRLAVLLVAVTGVVGAVLLVLRTKRRRDLLPDARQ